MKKKVIIGLVGIVSCGLLIWWGFFHQQPALVNELSVGIINLPSYYQRDVVWTTAPERPIPELTFLLETLRLVQSQGVLPTSLNQYDSTLLSTLEKQEKRRVEEQQIPETEGLLYLSNESAHEIQGLIRQMRQEYLDLIKAKEVAGEYIEAINTTILPDDPSHFHYFPYTSAESGSTNTHTYNQAPQGDWSSLQVDVYAWNVYQQAQQLQRSGVLGKVEEKVYRDMGLRYVVFHEMTHVLQQAVDVVNAPDAFKRSLIPWMTSTRRVLAIDSQYYQVWGSQTDQLTRDINNVTIAKESQAEGIAIQLLVEGYQLSSNQQRLVWEHHFGGLRQGTVMIEEIFKVVQEINPEVSLEYLLHQLRRPLFTQQKSSQTISRLFDRLEGLMATHVGYLHPMLPKDTHLFWEYLKE